MEERLSFTPTFALVHQRWRTFVVVAVAAIGLSAIFSGPAFLKPRYRSQAVVYPMHISTYSVESESDQLLQLLQSNAIRDSLVRRFGLAAHYGIDTTEAGGRALLNYLYNERVAIEKTRYESVDIRVTDEDPVLARDMVLAVVDQADQLARRLQRTNSAEMMKVVRFGLAATRQRMDSVEARLDQLRRGQGLLNYEVQAEEYTKGYMRALAANTGKAQRDEIGQRLKALEEHGGELQRLSLLNVELINDYNKQLLQERQLLVDLAKEFTYSDMVVYPEVPDKKVWPVRWLVVAITTASALLLCYVLLAIRANRAVKR